MNTRALTAELLLAVLQEKKSLTEVLPLAKKKVTTKDQGFLQALSFGVLRTLPRLLFIIDTLLKKSLKEKENLVLYLLCIGLYQLIEMRVPAHAAISETVAAARVLKKPWATGFINGVLRNFQRKAEAILQSVESNVEAKFAHPTWLINLIQEAYPDQYAEILNANNCPAPLVLRVNQQKTTRAAYLFTLSQQGIRATEIPFTEAGIVLETAQEVQTLPGFTKGLFSVQDSTAQLAATLLQLKPKLRILDACAAPGGKTTHILECEPELSEVVALDISKSRLEALTENLSRLTLKATVLCADAVKTETWWDGQPFDRILLDAPCSGVGVIRRHPDIKYLRQPTDILRLARQQLALLNALFPLLAPGGILLYVTCSILPQENQEVIKAFLLQNCNAALVPLTIPYALTETTGQTVLPGTNGVDGFYYACVRKLIE
jgi:16S rRNA (cytosine967-C5)-methyltransferase